jgi:hypothetical protein
MSADTPGSDLIKERYLTTSRGLYSSSRGADQTRSRAR